MTNDNKTKLSRAIDEIGNIKAGIFAVRLAAQSVRDGKFPVEFMPEALEFTADGLNRAAQVIDEELRDIQQTDDD